MDTTNISEAEFKAQLRFHKDWRYLLSFAGMAVALVVLTYLTPFIMRSTKLADLGSSPEEVRFVAVLILFIVNLMFAVGAGFLGYKTLRRCRKYGAAVQMKKVTAIIALVVAGVALIVNLIALFI